MRFFGRWHSARAQKHVVSEIPAAIHDRMVRIIEAVDPRQLQPHHTDEGTEASGQPSVVVPLPSERFGENQPAGKNPREVTGPPENEIDKIGAAPIEDPFERIEKRLDYVLTFAGDFEISNSQRKIGKKLVVKLKEHRKNFGSSDDEFENLASQAKDFMHKHLGDDADASISTLMSRVP